jgi:DNA-binding CsgD family transcriptional regulator
VAVDAASDALGVAIMSVGLDRRVRWTNAAGRSLLALGDTLGTDVMGRVTGAHAEVREALDEALAAAVRGEGTGKRTLTLPAVGNAPAVRLSLVVPALRSCEQYFAGPSVVLLVEPVAPAASLPEAALRGTFALTPTEARIACGVAAGARIADVAAAQGMTVATARVHLRNVFAKMNVRRQAELVVKVQSYR